VSLAHSSYDQWSAGVHVPRRALRPGDLVFFDGLGHVGIYIGGGRFLHAPHTGTVVSVDRLDGSWYGAEYEGAVRIRGSQKAVAGGRAAAAAAADTMGRWRYRSIRAPSSARAPSAGSARS
jgi:hypothetical protein